MGWCAAKCPFPLLPLAVACGLVFPQTPSPAAEPRSELTRLVEEYQAAKKECKARTEFLRDLARENDGEHREVGAAADPRPPRAARGGPGAPPGGPDAPRRAEQGGSP